jgi:hypothetical protein
MSSGPYAHHILVPYKLVNKKAFSSDPSQILHGDITSTSGRQPRAVAIVYDVLGVSQATLTNNSKGSFSHLVLEFLLDSLCLLWVRRALTNQIRNFYLDYLSIHIHTNTYICIYVWVYVCNLYNFR